MAAEERVLPHDLAAEKALLGAILLHNSAYEATAARLRPEHFYRDAHRRIYEAMQRLIDRRHRQVDFVTLLDELRQAKDLTEVGGPAYISSLIDGLPHGTNVAHYADIVREKALLRGVITVATAAIVSAYAPGGESTVVLQATDRALLDLQHTSAGRDCATSRTSAADLAADIERRIAQRGQLWGLDTGFRSINDETMGWQQGDLIVIAARPSVGKTTLAINSGLAAAKLGKTVAVFSLEMRQRQLDYRILSGLSGVPSRKIMGGYLAGSEFTAMSEAMCAYADLPLFINDRAGQTIGEIRLACRRLKNEQGALDLVVIDYVQLIPGTLDRRGATRNEEITDISARAKALAGELEVPVLLVSQLKRTGGARPTLEDLRESGSLEQDADLVCFLHRKNHKEGGRTEFIIEKARNGPTGTVNLSLDRDITTFTDAGEETPQQKERAAEEIAQAQRTKAIIIARAQPQDDDDEARF